MQSIPTQMQKADGYLTHQTRIANELMAAAKYSDLALKVRRNFDISPNFVKRSKSVGNQPAVPLLSTTHLLNKAYLNSPGINNQQKAKFRGKVAGFRVPCRDYSEAKGAQIDLDAINSSQLITQIAQAETSLNTESQILGRADLYQNPKLRSQAVPSSILFQNFKMQNINNAVTDMQIIPQNMKQQSLKERYEARQHKQFWREIVQVSKYEIMKDTKLDQVLVQAGQDPYLVNGNDKAICELDKTWTVLRKYKGQEWNQNVNMNAIMEKQKLIKEGQRGFRQRMFKSKLQSVKLESEAKIDVIPEFTGIGREYERSKSCGMKRNEDGPENWKQFRISQLKNMYREPIYKGLNQIGVDGKECEKPQVERAKSTGFNVLDQFKIKLQNKVIENARAASVKTNRSVEPEQIIELPIEKLTNKDLDTNNEIQDIEKNGFRPPPILEFDQDAPVQDQIEYLKKLHLIQKQMLIPGNAPLPSEFFDLCDELGQIEQPETILQPIAEVIPDEISFSALITSQNTKNNLVQKWQALNPLSKPFDKLQTHEQIEADRLYKLSLIKPRPITPENVRWIKNQRLQLETAQFAVQKFPQLAIFTKLSSLDVESIKEDLKQQIDQCEKEINFQNQAHDNELMQTLSDNAKAQQQIKVPAVPQSNFLTEMRTEKGKTWNDIQFKIDARNEQFQQKDRFGRVFKLEIPIPNYEVSQKEQDLINSQDLSMKIQQKISDLENQKQFLDCVQDDEILNTMKLDDEIQLREVSDVGKSDELQVEMLNVKDFQKQQFEDSTEQNQLQLSYGEVKEEDEEDVKLEFQGLE
ncbi:hypothetical protein SS50377_26345 [Spironucleus salmonicida]|uniref:Uncharacterized protein n=1 Tax=Spironucleus salmonicida TaxID=348837 RepID=V6LT12_9EUKA|nr:hypothetical protein SS50377_26345 [Spironucleus salmonicida]|eukprot:EST47787.1 Hypothetical protein SS50377_12187 [Spironucleus salmonicida]